MPGISVPGISVPGISVPGIPGPGIPSVPVNTNTPSADHAEAPPAVAPVRLSWARLLKAGIRDRHRAVPAVRRHLEAHRRHRRSPHDRQDPHAPRLVRPGTAPIARAAIRPIPNGLLIPGRAPPGSTPRADSLLWPALAREAKTPRIRAPRTDESPDKSSILDRPLAPLTTHRSIRTLPPSEKGRLKFLARPLAATKWVIKQSTSVNQTRV